MPNLKISELPSWTPISTDIIPYVDLTSWVTKKAPKSDLQWADGKTILNWTVDPTTEWVDGDFYINTTTQQIFWPKSGWVWWTWTSITLTWLWAYSWATSYIINDAVSFNWSSYVCKLATIGNDPTNTTYWDVLAIKWTDWTWDMNWPWSSTDNAIARFDSTTGKLLQNSNATVDDNWSINVPTWEWYNINGTNIKDVTETLTNKTLTSPKINVWSDATWDLYYRNGSWNLVRLPIWTTGQILTESGGVPSWQDAAGWWVSSWVATWVNTTSQVISHWFWSIPSHMLFSLTDTNSSNSDSHWYWDWTNQWYCYFWWTNTDWVMRNRANAAVATLSNVTSTQFTLTWSANGAWAYFRWSAF